MRNRQKGKGLSSGLGCLCWETETYSSECCDENDYHAQEIGNIGGGVVYLTDEDGNILTDEFGNPLIA